MKGFRQRVVRSRRKVITFTGRKDAKIGLTDFKHEQLSRAKDPNKSSKKGKDSASGNASPSLGSSPAGSTHGTPSSSQQNLNDVRNKPLPGENGFDARQAGAPTQGHSLNPGAQYMNAQPHHAQGLQAPGAPSTPNRGQPGMAPSVVISPSAPVSADDPDALPVKDKRGFSSFLTFKKHPPPPGAAETMPGDLAPPKAGPKSLLFNHLGAKDIPEGIRTPKRQHSSRFDVSDQKQRELEKLPGFSEVPPNRRQDLFMQKIEQCNIIFDFNDASADPRSKEIKRLALHELLDYVANNRQVITEAMYPKAVEMFSKNLFRPIPPPMNPQGDAFDPEEDEPVLEVAWPHIQVVYEFFLRFIESQDFNTNIAKQYIDHQFVLQVRLKHVPLQRRRC